jgi:hypothetical protein
MDQLLAIFQAELKGQCKQAEVVGEQLNAALKAGNHVDIWIAVQSILLTAGNTAKLLWGSGNGKAAEATEADRKPLRTLVGVADESPLKARNVRNSFEHFDERIIAWHEASETQFYASRQIGQAEDWPAGALLGNYDPATGIVTFLDNSVSIRDLMVELHRILEKLNAQ